MSDEQENLPKDSELFDELYSELKNIARVHMQNERADHTLQPTALINEAYLRMTRGEKNSQWESRKHFLNTAAKVMRRLLIDSARASRSQKRGGDVIRVELTDQLETSQSSSSEYVIALHEALLKFEKVSPKKAELVTLRYFAGLTLEEAAQTLGISPSTASNYWLFGRAWLHRELTA